MKKIDAHSHIGNFGGWAGVAFTKQKLIEQMDEYDIEKTFLTAPNFQGNDGVVLAPSALGITTGSPPSITLTQLFVVPKSIPIIFAIIFFLLNLYY
jgi:hypothetical protein